MLRVRGVPACAIAGPVAVRRVVMLLIEVFGVVDA
jgi:hypothetical protein